jgi:hypothetical protein
MMRKRLKLALYRWKSERLRRAALSGASTPEQNPTVSLVRIIGNDLWPRHARGQALENLDFILTHEPSFAGCRKLFVLNRIVDGDTAARADAMIRQAGHEVMELPFDPALYAKLRMDTDFFGGDEYFLSPAFARLSEFRQGVERLWAAAPKVRYVMNINGARNAAMAHCLGRSDWTLVLDGSCFLSDEAFSALRDNLIEAPMVSYVVLPLHRLERNEDAFTIRPEANETEEPQLVFHASAMGRFDERFPYGMRDKTELLVRMGVPGAWDLWVDMPWLPASEPLADRHRWKRARCAVFRLTSGVAGGDLEQTGAHRKRYTSRTQAIFQTLATLDARLCASDRDRARLILGLRETHD